MPKILEIPEKLRGYIWHGMCLSWQGRTDGEAVSDCPWCDKEGKFSVNVERGVWKCWSCGTGTLKGGGNPVTFLRELWNLADKSTTDYDGLAAERKLLKPETLAYWGAAVNPLTGDWVLPGYGIDKKLSQLYRYSALKPGGKRFLQPTPGLSHGLFGVPYYDPRLSRVYVCEGPWDGMALWETLEGLKRLDGSVLAVPGCNVFREDWLPLFDGKTVILLYDSDYPPRDSTTGQVRAPAGYAGMRRAASQLGNAKEVMYLHWGNDGYDSNLPSGHDVRDFLSIPGRGDDLGSRGGLLDELLAKVRPAPKSWNIVSRSVAGRSLETLPCDRWDTLIHAWKRALSWTDGLERALTVMLSSITSTKAVGDQLWVKIIGPPSSGKSVLCEAISTNKKYVVAKSTIRGFHSGFQSRGRGSKEDNSLLALLKDRTLVTKDGDTLLQSPNRGQILSEARDIYDRVSRTHYRNKTSRDYEGYSLTWILCGTESLRALDDSELGERFLDCVIVDTMPVDLERDIALRLARRQEREMALISDGRLETRDGPELVKAKQLTGGYINHLRENARDLLESVEAPDDALRYCTRLAEFVSFVRARPSQRQAEKVQRELCFRLTGQFVRLAKSAAVVLQRASLDPTVMEVCRRVALDTARGRTLALVQELYRLEPNGADTKSLAGLTYQPVDKEQTLLIFLRRLGVVGVKAYNRVVGIMSVNHWVLTPRLRELYVEVAKP